MWDLAPEQESKPGPPVLGAQVLGPGPPGKSLGHILYNGGKAQWQMLALRVRLQGVTPKGRGLRGGMTGIISEPPSGHSEPGLDGTDGWAVSAEYEDRAHRGQGGCKALRRSPILKGLSEASGTFAGGDHWGTQGPGVGESAASFPGSSLCPC